MMKQHHYTGTMPVAIRLIGAWRLQPDKKDRRLRSLAPLFLAACVISVPPTRWKEPVLELTRLVRVEDDRLPYLSGLIADTVGIIRRQGMADLIVSYADPSENHHGGVYQACSWQYHGQRKPSITGLDVNGWYVPGRTCNDKWGTRSARKLQALFPEWQILPHRDTGKHLYWKALNRRGKRKAQRLGLQSKPYPKPNEH